MVAALRERLQDRLTREIQHLPLGQASAGAEALVSLTLELPQLPNRIAECQGAQFQFLRASDDGLRAGYGKAAEWESQGPERLRALAAVARVWGAHWQRFDPDVTGFDAFAMLGFAAAPDPAPQIEDHLPNAILWVPDLGLRQHHERAALVFTGRQAEARTAVHQRWSRLLDEVLPGLFGPPARPSIINRVEADFAEPDQLDWSSLVDLALAEIRAGTVEKVVLSRRLDVQGSRRFEIARLLDVLATAYPSCRIINLRRNGSSFVAATPERLLRFDGRAVTVDAIAGTTGRSECSERDRALGAELRHSEKNLREHAFVVDAVRQALEPCCRAIEVPPAPELMQLRNAQHLWSPISAEASPGTDIFDLAERLHPTPATNGQPRLAAHQWLRAQEPFARGWYTGAAGFIQPDTSGELWVLLRCARICGARAELYAGAGIVTGSDPQAEWDETEAKLAAMLTALQFA